MAVASDRSITRALPVPLGPLAAELGGQLLEPSLSEEAATSAATGEVLVRGVQQDSRRIEPGDLFVALRGQSSDGAAFASAAVARGAVAVLCERGRALTLTVPTVEVDAVRLAMARAAARVYGQPSEQLTVVGITGTNGKTTTAHMIGTCLAGCGVHPAVVGTLGYFFEGEEHPSTHTSPEADEIQRVAATLLGQGASHLVMEVSSIALAAERMAEMSFDVAVFTNLTQDHLDYHGTMEAYAAAKEQLFFEHRPPVAVINVDDSFGAKLAERVAQAGHSRLIRVSLQRAVEVFAAQHSLTVGGMQLSLSVAGQPGTEGDAARRCFEARAPFSGTFNISNVLCAIAVVEALGLDLGAALAALESAAPVPGRLERCDGQGDDIVALVDYAHTPGALERVLESIRPPAGRKLW